MPSKRKYSNKKRTISKKYGTSVRNANTAAKTIQAAVRRAISKNIETKHASTTSNDYTQISHNSFISLDSSLLATTQGIQDPKSSFTACRIGDNITLVGVSIKMMIELNERYSDVTYRIIVVKSSKGDTPTASTLFVGLSGNKMLDKLDRERYTICYEKWGQIKNTAQGGGRLAAQDSTVTEPSTGIYGASQTPYLFSRATKIIKFWLPYKKLMSSPVIQYENAS